MQPGRVQKPIFSEHFQARLADRYRPVVKANSPKDRAEQQLVVGMLDGVREWLAFTLPPPGDKLEAQALAKARNEQFMKLLPLRFVSKSKAKVTELMEVQESAAELCPTCLTGRLKCKEGRSGLFWYCTNWNAEPKCDARYEDAGGRPQLTKSAAV